MADAQQRQLGLVQRLPGLAGLGDAGLGVGRQVGRQHQLADVVHQPGQEGLVRIDASQRRQRP